MPGEKHIRLESSESGTKDPKKRSHATALGYEPGKDEAPRVLAAGYGKIAENIISLAQEYNIPIHEDPLLAAALAMLDINETIPEELYAVVAEVLAYVYRIQNRTLDA